MKTAEEWDRNDFALIWRFSTTATRCITIEPLVRAMLVIVLKILGQDSIQVSFAQHNDMIETLSADRTDDALRVRILPGAVIGRSDFFDAEACHAMLKFFPVDRVVVTQEIFGRFIKRKGFHNLLPCPASSRMLGDVEVNNLPPVVRQKNEDVEQSKRRGWHDKEITSGDFVGMVLEKRTSKSARGAFWGEPCTW